MLTSEDSEEKVYGTSLYYFKFSQSLKLCQNRKFVIFQSGQMREEPTASQPTQASQHLGLSLLPQHFLIANPTVSVVLRFKPASVSLFLPLSVQPNDDPFSLLLKQPNVYFPSITVASNIFNLITSHMLPSRSFKIHDKREYYLIQGPESPAQIACLQPVRGSFSPRFLMLHYLAAVQFPNLSCFLEPWAFLPFSLPSPYIHQLFLFIFEILSLYLGKPLLELSYYLDTLIIFYQQYFFFLSHITCSLSECL